MSSNVTKFCKIRSSILLCLFSSALSLPVLAGGKHTGKTYLIPESPNAGQPAKLYVGATGDTECNIQIDWGDGSPIQNTKTNNAGIEKVFQKGGKFSITVKKNDNACTGFPSSVLATVKPQLKIPTMTPTSCAAGFENQTVSPQDGELKCRKNPQPCPTHWDGSVDSATGKLECSPKVVACPDGWVGGIQNGKLVCNSAPLPKVSCAESTPTNQWGASYFTDGWRVYGCSKNLAAPK